MFKGDKVWSGYCQKWQRLLSVPPWLLPQAQESGTPTSKYFLSSGFIKKCGYYRDDFAAFYWEPPLYIKQIFELRQNMVVHNRRQEGEGNGCLDYLYSDILLTVVLEFSEISGLKFGP